MIAALLNGLLKFFLWIIGLISTIVFYPTQALLVFLFPDIGDWLVNLIEFFRYSVFPFISFLKNFFLNITCMPPELFMILVDTFFGFIVTAILFRTFMLIWRVYLIVRGAQPK